MLLRLFTSRQPLLLVSVPLLAALGLLPRIWILAPTGADWTAYPAEGWMAALCSGLPLGDALPAWVLVVAGALRVNQLFNRHQFYPSPVYIPALIYTVASIAFMQQGSALHILAANLFIVAGIDYILRVSRQPRVLNEYFRGGFWLGLGALLFPPFLLLGIAMWLGIAFLRPFQWREYAVSALAFAVPFIWWIAILFFNDLTEDIWLITRQINTPWLAWWKGSNAMLRIVWIFSAISLLFAIPRLLFPTERASNRARNLAGVFLLYFFVSLAAVIGDAWLTGIWNLTALLVPFTVATGVWYAHYRYSLFAPFVFYGWLLSCILYVAQCAGVPYL